MQNSCDKVKVCYKKNVSGTIISIVVRRHFDVPNIIFKSIYRGNIRISVGEKNNVAFFVHIV